MTTDQYIVDITNGIVAVTGLIVALSALIHGKNTRTIATENKETLANVVKTNNLDEGKGN